MLFTEILRILYKLRVTLKRHISIGVFVMCLTFHQNHVVWQKKIKNFWRNGNDSKQAYWVYLDQNYIQVFCSETTES